MDESDYWRYQDPWELEKSIKRTPFKKPGIISLLPYISVKFDESFPFYGATVFFYINRRVPHYNITVKEGLTESEQKLTLIHELFHAFYRTKGDISAVMFANERIKGIEEIIERESAIFCQNEVEFVDWLYRSYKDKKTFLQPKIEFFD